MKKHKSLQTALVVVGLTMIVEPVAAQSATDLNCRNCVNGRHVANSSLTGADVRNGSLTGSDVRNGSMTGADVRNSSLTGSDVRNGSLTGSDVRNSTLTGADVRNSSLTGSDVRNSSLTGSDIRNDSLTSSDIRDGTIQAQDLAPDAVFMRTRIVSPVGGDDSTANGQELLDALAAIIDSGPSAAEPWLLKIEPGTYWIGGETLAVPSHVYVEGSGLNITIIQGGFADTVPVVELSGNSGLSQLAVWNLSGTDLIGMPGLVDNAIALRINAPDAAVGEAALLDRVTTFVTGGLITGKGVVIQGSNCTFIDLNSVSAVVWDFEGDETGFEFNCDAGAPAAIKMYADGGGGAGWSVVNNSTTDATVTIQNATLIGLASNAGNLVFGGALIDGNLDNGTGATMKVIASELTGVVEANDGTIKCVGAYDSAGDELDAGCAAP